jgi:hypothetical protein
MFAAPGAVTLSAGRVVVFEAFFFGGASGVAANAEAVSPADLA